MMIIIIISITGILIREPVKNYLADSVRSGGGVPPLSAKLF